ncbi:MAG: hypothetical protein K2G45_06265 [Lachnospiraceae bacterium]|nr:hypothetical protein [Lachnospiraceae bacterium]
MILKLIIGNILGNKKKTISSILGICISVMLIFVVINTYVSFQKMRLENAYDAYGEYNIILHEVNQEAYKWINNKSDRYTLIGVEKIIGVTDSQIAILDSGRNSTQMNRYKLVEGTFPEQAGEVAISATAKLNDEFIISKYNVGDSIELNGSNYVISGILDDYDYSTVDTYKVALIKSENAADIYNIYLHCAGKREYLRALKEIKEYLGLDDSSIYHGDKEYGFLSGYTMILNDELNLVEFEGNGGLDDVNIGRMLFFFAVVLILSSVILGLHIFASYLHGRNKQQGILLSLGFPNLYISCMYFVECLILVVVGCLMGTLFGRYLTAFLFDCIQNMRVTRLENFKPQFTAQSYMLAITVSTVGFICGLLPVIVRNMNAGIHEMIKSRRKKYIDNVTGVNKHKRKFITFKYFRKDSYTFEKICIYTSMIMIGLSLVLLIYVNKYVNYTLSLREEHDSKFVLLSDDISLMGGFEKLIPGVTYYDMVYDTHGVFHVGRDNINEKYKDVLMFKEADSVYCEIAGVSEQQYNNKIESDSGMTYEEFVNMGGAIVIDNYLTGDDRILKELPETLKYDGRYDYDFGITYDPGEVKIIGHGKFKNWDDQRGISIIVPDEMFKEKFDYTTVRISINVKDGYEIKAAEMLNQCALKYKYSFHDYVTEYIKEQDNNMTIRVYTYGVFLFITVMNLFIIVYVNILVYIRRGRNISILKTLGHSDIRIICPMIIEVIVQSIVGAVISVFISTVASKRLLPEVTQHVILTNGAGNILYVLLFLVVTQMVAITVIFIRVRKQEIIYDLR